MKSSNGAKNNRLTKLESENDSFQHKKSLGQNFLTSDVVPKWLVAAGEVMSTDTVLEIGPGTGALTRVLLATGATIVAVEADSRAIAILEVEFAAEIERGQLTIHHLDARTLDVAGLELQSQSFKVVANIPYYLSGFLLRTLLETAVQPTTLVFLMQKEVVSRIARAKKESILSLSVKAFGTPKYIKTVTRGHFNPAPNVDSAILQITDINLKNFKNSTDLTLFFKLLHLGFGKKRKQLLGNLAEVYPREQLVELFTTTGISLTTRAEDVSLPIWLKLVSALNNHHDIHKVSPAVHN